MRYPFWVPMGLLTLFVLIGLGEAYFNLVADRDISDRVFLANLILMAWVDLRGRVS